MTLRQYVLLKDAWLEEQRRRDWRAGAIYELLANVHRARGTRRPRASDAFPSLKRQRAKKAMTPQQIVAEIKARLGGPRG